MGTVFFTIIFFYVLSVSNFQLNNKRISVLHLYKCNFKIIMGFYCLPPSPRDKAGKAGLQLVRADLIFSKRIPFSKKKNSLPMCQNRFLQDNKLVKTGLSLVHVIDGDLIRSKPVQIIKSHSNPVKVGSNRSKTSPGGQGRSKPVSGGPRWSTQVPNDRKRRNNHFH